jgi:hypothetical protein
VEGKLATRADAAKHQGDYRKIVEGVNKTLDAVIGPLNVAAEYVDRISKGDIPPKITDTYNGDFNTLKNNLNTCVDSVNALVADAALLGRAAVEGKNAEWMSNNTISGASAEGPFVGASGFAVKFKMDVTEKASGKRLSYFDPDKKVHYHPYVIEPAAGADRTALAFLLDAYTEEPPSEMRKEGRVLLKLHPRLAPIKVAVFPLVKKDGMPEAARKIVAEFYRHGVNAFYDEKDAVGRRYARQDEAGTPYCLTVDGQTAQDETVTIRERDTMKQERIKVDEAVKVVQKRLAG